MFNHNYIWNKTTNSSNFIIYHVVRLQTWYHDVQGSCLVHSIVTTQWITTNTALIRYIPCLTCQWLFPCIFHSCNKFQRISATSFLPATWNNKSHWNLNSTQQLATKHSPFFCAIPRGLSLVGSTICPGFFFSNVNSNQQQLRVTSGPTDAPGRVQCGAPIAVINGVIYNP